MSRAWPAHVLVKGAGSEGVDGVYSQQEGITHEGCPVYGSLKDS